MDNHITEAREIPKSPLYVVATDNFMSNWGHARGCDNVLIFTADCATTAYRLEFKLNSRNEMRRVRINMSKPRIKPHWYAQLFTPETHPAWYE